MFNVKDLFFPELRDDLRCCGNAALLDVGGVWGSVRLVSAALFERGSRRKITLKSVRAAGRDDLQLGVYLTYRGCVMSEGLSAKSDDGRVATAPEGDDTAGDDTAVLSRILLL